MTVMGLHRFYRFGGGAWLMFLIRRGDMVAFRLFSSFRMDDVKSGKVRTR